MYKNPQSTTAREGETKIKNKEKWKILLNLRTEENQVLASMVKPNDNEEWREIVVCVCVHVCRER